LKTGDIFYDLPVLETERLLLRKLTLDDAEDMFEYASDPEVTKYLVWVAHQDIEDSREFLKSVLDRYRKGLVASWGVVHKLDEKLIGTCGYISWLPHGDLGKHARAELGFALSRKYWGQGLMPEAVREVITFGFRKMQLNRIQATCEVENLASERVLEKVGMKFEGVLREYMYAKGAYRDLKMFSILRSEWAGD